MASFLEFPCVAFTSMAPPSPSLFRMVSEEWRESSDLIAHIEQHPEDLVWSDLYGNTALHRLCCRHQNPSQDVEKVVNAMIKIRPELVATQNNAGWTPLHLCVEKRLVLKPNETLVSIALKMIESCPRAVSIATQSGSKRMTPFHLACLADADIRVLRAMLQVDPSLATREYAGSRENMLSYHSQMGNQSSALHLLWQGNKNSMEKMALLLLTAFEGHAVDEPMPMNHMLHAACKERCPRMYLVRLVSEYSDQASQPDDAGNLPLHYAVKHGSIDSQAYTKFLLEELLRIHPQAATQRDADGRLPLHIALTGDSQLTWHKGGISELVTANPEALYTLDTTDRLYPVLTSALHATQSRLHLSTTYELLLAAPGVVQHGLRE